MSAVIRRNTQRCNYGLLLLRKMIWFQARRDGRITANNNSTGKRRHKMEGANEQGVEKNPIKLMWMKTWFLKYKITPKN